MLENLNWENDEEVVLVAVADAQIKTHTASEDQADGDVFFCESRVFGPLWKAKYGSRKAAWWHARKHRIVRGFEIAFSPYAVSTLIDCAHCDGIGCGACKPYKA